jgi:hypothetical protein
MHLEECLFCRRRASPHFYTAKTLSRHEVGCNSAAQRAPHVPKDDANTGPLISFARSGIAAHWKASAYQSILELAEAVRRSRPLVVPDGCLSQL